MSEVDARPPPTRGRSSYRGGRGGFGRGGPRGGSRKPVNGTATDAFEDSADDQGELGEMKKQYSSQLSILKDMFPDWTDVDLVFALQETDGDIASTVEKITQGNVSQFAEVKSTKDRARSKVKDAAPAAGAIDKPAGRGGRGRGGFDTTRGTRGRGSDRGRGGFRGARGGHATSNGTTRDAAGASVPTTESTAWDDTTNATAAEGGWDTATADTTTQPTAEGEQSAWANVVTAEQTPAAASEGAKSSLIPEGGPKKSWASMFAPKPAPAPVKKAPQPQQPPPAELVASGAVPPAATEAVQDTPDVPGLPPAPADPEPPAEVAAATDISTPEVIQTSAEGEELSITPSKVPLTEENVEHLPDESHPPATQTAASTTGSVDPRNLTPLPTAQDPMSRPPLGGYATSAHRATGAPGRSASFQRRVLEQQEAVVMPGHSAVDRAAVQFGSMGLNGEAGMDPDEDREEPETRHAPQHSPPSQPRASLPPAPRQAPIPQEQAMPESLPTPKQAPGLPPASQQNQQQVNETPIPAGLPSEPSQMSQSYNQYGRYGQPGMQQESAMPQQKPYDPFSHQAQPSHYDQYGNHAQQLPQQSQQTPGGFGGLSSAPNDMSQYYTSDHQQRSAYSNYYGSGYGPQDVRSQIGQSQHDAGLGQQRSASGFGAGPNEPAFSSQSQQQVSIPTSLLELNDALNKCNDEDERHFLLKEIQRVVTSGCTQPKHKGLPAYRVPPKARDSAIDRLFMDTPVTDQKPISSQLPADVTNIQPPIPSSIYLSQSSISNIPTKQAHSRFADNAGSGNNTPAPLGQQHSAASGHQSQQNMHQAPGHQQQSGYGGGHNYGYGQYYGSPYQQSYQQHQYGGYGNQGSGYGGGYQSKHGGMYGQSHGYGMGPQSSYDQHSASPANSSAFSQNQQTSMRSASGMGSGLGGLDDYGRSSSQSHQQTSGFGGMSDAFARSSSGFGGQQSGYGQSSMAGPEESLKPFSDSKGGPSPAPGQLGGRPGSAANSAVGSNPTALPPPQSHQSGFGGYPGFPSQSQYGSLGGLGGQGQQQQLGQGQGGYGSYGGSGFGQYGGYSRGGGWGANYGGQH